jgi:hypothetical protein
MRYNSKSVLNSFFRIRNILFTPQQEWARVAHEDVNTRELFFNYTLPIVFCCALIEGIGFSIHKDSIALGIIQFFVAFGALNAGIYSAVRILEFLSPNFQLQIKRENLFKLVIYSASVFCIFHATAKLFSPYSFLNQLCLILELYFIRVLWLGINPLIPIASSKRAGYTIIASLLILVLPILFERMFSILFKLPITI